MLDLLLLNGLIYTGEGLVDSMGVKDGRVASLGGRGPAKRTVDLDGRVVIPGFIDAHIHVIGLALSRSWLDLSPARSIKEMLDMLRRYAEGKSGWIVGRGWDHERFDEGRMPTKDDLDSVVGDRPVMLIRVCGHVAVLNSKAMDLLGLWGSGMHIRRDGKPTGIIVEDLVEKALNMVPKPPPREMSRLVGSVADDLLSNGVTEVGVMGVDEYGLGVLSSVETPVRMHIYVRRGFWAGGPMIRGVKLFSDGSLGGWTAALTEPYSDRRDTAGRLLLSAEEIRLIGSEAEARSLQLAIHAIGDRALMNVAEGLKGLRGRHRVEHASLAPPEVREALRAANPVIVVQPRFILSDSWAVSRLGSRRARWLYPFRSFLEEGFTLAIGSDSPVEPFNPFEHIYAAVTRGEREGSPLRTPEERLTVGEALEAYTLGSAAAVGSDAGSLSTGRPANLVVLDHREELEKTDPATLRGIRVHSVFIGGAQAYPR